MGEVLLQARGIDKTFGRVQALRGVDLDVRMGEVHAVLGANGAGKSTLTAILAGLLRADAGEVIRHGHRIDMVHQHFTLVPAFTIAENLALARLESLTGGLDVEALARPALELAQRLGWKLDPQTRVESLPVGTRQRVEIVKALAGGGEIVIFDEPTAVLSEGEVENVLGVIRRLAEEGRGVVLIAHKLAEVFRVADRIAVLRRGVCIGEFRAAETTPAEVALAMVGEPSPIPVRPAATFGEVRVRAEGLRVKGDRGHWAVDNVSLEARAGEILGIGGVDGNGQIELAEALAGVRSPSEGRLVREGEAAYIPPDRQTDGLALGMTLVDNFLIAGVRRPDLGPGPWLSPTRVRAWCRDLVRRFGIKIGSLTHTAASLSGGNQQKIVVARALADPPKLLVAVNPTRGLDLAASAFVAEQMRAAASTGSAVILFSGDRDELADLADRTLYLSAGRLSESESTALVGARE